MNFKQVNLITVEDFFMYFEDCLPEGVGVDEYMECIEDSDISFGCNTDTLLNVYEAFTFFLDATRANYHGALNARYREFVDMLIDKNLNIDKDVFINLGR